MTPEQLAEAKKNNLLKYNAGDISPDQFWTEELRERQLHLFQNNEN